MDLFEGFKNINKFKVLIIGDLMLDHYIFGDSKRLSPEAPVPVVVFEHEDYMLGGCGNLSRNLKAFNIECGLISLIGDDFSGKLVTTELEKLGIGTNNLVVSRTRPTTVKKRIISRNQQIVRVDTEAVVDLSLEEEAELSVIFLNNYLQYDLVVISDYSKGVITNKLSSIIIENCKKKRIKVFVDPKKKDFKSYSFATLVKPNLYEAELVFGKKIDSIELLKEAADEIKSNFGIGTIVITLGPKGIFYSSDNYGLVPGIDVSISDVSGAGDTVLASLVLCECLGLSLKDSVRFANVAASIVVQNFGTTVTTIENVLNQFSYE
jgi:D-beta-D-heptose 7-phosphate kinase/D-beta-D-heptose 1-phosphate adenosyltransferase